MVYLSDKQLADRFAVSRRTIWNWFDAGHFPAPVRLSRSVTRWRLPDVEAFENERIAASAA
ncbi:AlpA family phage regulatory protein [Ponticoccus gilvus]|nr:AlpA family phage regulatory protein [Enemella evansiae]